jgi:hypothetical protein
MSTMAKQEKFELLTNKLTNLIRNELFLTDDQKLELTDELFCINKRVQAGMMRGIEIRLHAIYNSLRAHRTANLFPKG